MFRIIWLIRELFTVVCSNCDLKMSKHTLRPAKNHFESKHQSDMIFQKMSFLFFIFRSKIKKREFDVRSKWEYPHRKEERRLSKSVSFQPNLTSEREVMGMSHFLPRNWSGASETELRCRVKIPWLQWMKISKISPETSQLWVLTLRSTTIAWVVVRFTFLVFGALVVEYCIVDKAHFIQFTCRSSITSITNETGFEKQTHNSSRLIIELLYLLGSLVGR